MEVALKWVEAGRVLRLMIEQAEIAMKCSPKVILVRAQKEKRRTEEKAPVFLENTQIIMSRMLVEMRMVKAILVRSQMEIRNMLLDSGGKAILVTNWQRTWLNCGHVLVFCGR